MTAEVAQSVPGVSIRCSARIPTITSIVAWAGLENADFRATDSGSAVSNVVGIPTTNRWPISGPRLLGPLIRSGSPLVL